MNRNGFFFGMAAVGLTIPFAIYLYATVYMRWMADDWCIINQFRPGNLAGIAYYYTNWSGRFANYLTTGLIEPTGLISAILFTIAMLVVWWIALFGIIQAFARKRGLPVPATLSVIVTSLLIIAMLNGALSPVQSVYWLAGSTGYCIPLVLLTFYVWLGVRHITFPQGKTLDIVSLVSSGVLLFFVSGYMEVLGLVQITCLGIALLLIVRHRMLRPIRAHVIAGLTGTALGLLVNLIAPGNYVRLFQYLPQTAKFDLLVFLTGVLGSPVTTGVFTAVFWPIGPIALIGVPAFIAYRFDSRKLGKWKVRHDLKRLLFFIYITLVVSMGGFMILTKTLPAGRLWFIPQYFLFCGYIAVGYWVGLSFNVIR